MIGYTNLENGKRVSYIFKQVGWSWRIVDLDPDPKEGTLCEQVWETWIHTDTDGTPLRRSILLPAPPLPTTQEEWDRMLDLWRSCGDEGRGKLLSTFNKGKKRTPEEQKNHDRQVRRDRNTQRRWIRDMTAVWLKVNGGKVSVDDVLTGKDRGLVKRGVSFQDLKEHLTSSQLRRWGVGDKDMEIQQEEEWKRWRKEHPEFLR